MAYKGSLLSTKIISRDHEFSRPTCCLLSCIKRVYMTSQWRLIPKQWKGGQIGVPVKPVLWEFSYVKKFFCSKNICIAAGHVSEIHLYRSGYEYYVGTPKWGDREAIWEISLKKVILKHGHEAQFFHHKNTKVKANF